MKRFRDVTKGAIAAAALSLACSSAALAGIGDDHAEISNLLNIYAFALDGQDADTYASTFTTDAVLNYGGGEARGRDAIRKMVTDLRARPPREGTDPTLRPARSRHFLTNLVIDVNGSTARVKDYWMSVNNMNAERKAELSSFGHGENELKRVDGKWLIARRVIYNEQVPARAMKDDNPSFLAPKR